MFAAVAVRRLNLERHIRDAVAQFRALLREGVVVDFFQQPEIEQAIFLLLQLRQFTLEPIGLHPRIDALLLRPFPQRFAEPVTDFIALTDRAKDGEHLAVEVSFRDTDARMIADVVHGAAVVDVLLAGGFLRHLFPRDQIATVGTFGQPAGVGELVGLVRLAAKYCLHAVPHCPFHERLVFPRIPLALVFQFADVGAVEQDVVD